MRFENIEAERYDLYKRNFPDNVRARKTEEAILSFRDNIWLEERTADGTLIGAALVNRSAVLMLCVDAPYRNRGIGSALLQKAEAQIKHDGFDTVTVGVGVDYLMPGVPIRGDNVSFFQKRGYTHAWEDCECFDMAMDLADFVPDPEDAVKLGGVVNGIRYRFAKDEDFEGIKSCLEDAAIKFLKYYIPDWLYEEGSKERILIAEDTANGEICGTLLVGLETEVPNVGSVGCTAVELSYRYRGIATNMVRAGTRYLRDAGMRGAFLGYTYSGLDKLYGASGYHITTKYMMAEKTL